MLVTGTLRDGRTVEYVDLGPETGVPVLFLHGTPSTGGQAGVVADAAAEHGIRLVAPSRPGYGATTLSPPSLAATARDLLEVAELVGLERLAVLGASGGGPFALAVAALAGDRVTQVAVHAGPGACVEVDPGIRDDPEGRAVALRDEGDLAGALELLTTATDAELAELRTLSATDFSAAMRTLRPPDETWLDEHPAARDVFDADFRRSIATSDGYVRDNLSWCGAWDIDLSAIEPRVRLVYGDADTMVPPAHADWLLARLPRADLHVVPGGHGHATFAAMADTFAVIAAAPRG